ncbi:hypothetical protein RB594_006526 [Gaeumannomyces avenae]
MELTRKANEKASMKGKAKANKSSSSSSKNNSSNNKNNNNNNNSAGCRGAAATSSTAPSGDEPLFFFKPDEAYGEFCQWYPSNFSVTKAEMSRLLGHPVDNDDPEGWGVVYFSCAEQFMMYCKAGRFRDRETQARVLATRDPKEQKRLGRATAGFRAEEWDPVKSAVVVAGNVAKFGQNRHLRDVLVGTGDRLLAEAAPYDRVWGIGYTAKVAAQQPRESWGENRLGRALMEARERLREED